MSAADLRVIDKTDRPDFALFFFAEQRAKAAITSAPPPLGLHLVMGENTPLKPQNLVRNIALGRLAPVELTAHRDY